MKTLVVVLTFMVTLLAGSFSQPMAYAMPMSDTISDVHDMASTHDCCDEAATAEDASCHEESSFCQHCEQHCAGQIGLIGAATDVEPAIATHGFMSSNLSLWQLSERLIRPPKLSTAS